ncbi:hypothetical protein BHE97_02865 [Aeromicrobium sp. PE09-221]|nr:hypothetical protein BHE97_02865 [Aeromicrobium sp. PE09-221]
MLTWTVGPAVAHAQLIGSTPAEDEVLDTAPAQVELEFNEELIEIGSTMLVIDSDGENRVAGEVALDGRFVRADLAPDLPDGSYEIRWRVVSADGHPISGRIPFAIGAPGDPVPEAEGTAAASADDADSGDPGGLPGRAIVIAIAGAAVALAVWFAISGRRRP